MKKNIAILTTLVMCCSMLFSCITTSQFQEDEIYNENADNSSVAVITYGTPYYNTEGLVLYYVYNNMFYYPYYHNNRYYLHRYFSPLTTLKARMYKPVPMDFYRYKPLTKYYRKYPKANRNIKPRYNRGRVAPRNTFRNHKYFNKY